MNNRKSKKIFIETYGCQMNLSDSELMAGILTTTGHRIVDEPELEEVILVNTCAVRKHAEQRVIGRLGDLKRYKQKNPDLIIGVCGCMAQHLGERLVEAVPYVDLVMGPDSYGFKTAVFPKNGTAKTGQIVKVKVVDVTAHTLLGKINGGKNNGILVIHRNHGSGYRCNPSGERCRKSSIDQEKGTGEVKPGYQRNKSRAQRN